VSESFKPSNPAIKMLAVATSGGTGALAIGNTQVVWDKKAMHSELATVKLEELLAQTQLKLSDLTHIAVNVGPGSFTGIRVGINLARTLAYGLGIPVASFNTLALLAAKNLQDGERGLIALKAVQHYFYAAVYQRHADGLLGIHAPASYEHQHLAELGKSCTKVCIEGESTRFSTSTDALDLVHWLERWPNSKHFFPWKEIKPLYIRASEAEEKLRKGLLKPLT
jgi:tRNA threonylcarbamoyl adenosine modification protein YeaZ